MNQNDLVGIICSRPQNFAWFLGAGASRSAGLPTATDLLWDLKRQYYCRIENQDISRQDAASDALRTRIQEFMEARGFPPLWHDDEYPAYFERIFAEHKEHQRRFIKKRLADENVALHVGHRVLGAMISAGFCRILFTTNFDGVVEKAVAELDGQALAAFHLEGSHAANQALNNEEFPIYCKLHGDFRYDSIKNLPADLAHQNQELSRCLVNAGNRFGFIVTGYSGRDESIVNLFESVLDAPNPFPHGFYWTGMKNSPVLPAVDALLERARDKGVEADYVPIETFDSLLSRIWRNIDDKPADLDARVRKSRIPLKNMAVLRVRRTL